MFEVTNTNKEYKTLGHVRCSCQYHVIFCPKYRRKVLVDGIDVRLKELVRENQELHGYEILEMEVMPDHVHLLLDIPPKKSVVQVVGRIKGLLSNRLRNEFPKLRSRLPTLWTRSCFISSVGAVSLEVVKKYIEEQKNV